MKILKLIEASFEDCHCYFCGIKCLITDRYGSAYESSCDNCNVSCIIDYKETSIQYKNKFVLILSGKSAGRYGLCIYKEDLDTYITYIDKKINLSDNCSFEDILYQINKVAIFS